MYIDVNLFINCTTEIQIYDGSLVLSSLTKLGTDHSWRKHF